MSGTADDRAPGAEETAPAKRRKRRRRSKPDDGGGPSLEERAARALTELRVLARELAAEQGGPRSGRFPVETLDVALTIPMGGAPEQVRPAAQTLLGHLRERLDEALRGAVAFREGHVYCFHTDQPESPYSQPPDANAVFAGYAANGRPEWRSFPNLCLERREPRVDRLYADPPEVIAIVQTAEELSGDLLPGFGRRSLAYAVLGQVVVGLVPRDLDLRGRGERVAVTLQLVETTQGTRDHRLRLNLLGLPSDDIITAAAEADERSPAEAFRKVLRTARQRIDALGRQLALAARRGEEVDRDRLVEQILSRLRTDVLRVLKVRGHRTQHAEVRHQSGERPTSLALQDARAAVDGRLFDDTYKHTIVVLGPKQRAHVFTAGGRHVTSLVLDPGELERKLERRRWRPLDAAAAEAFRRAVAGAERS
ncbi:MAG: hypothetical protein EP329_25180 [Deltaproteobacteria bacterium]|nr:MAG: hypothetical protein EP329_25180 [Deltaproteobacteria bacterium]